MSERFDVLNAMTLSAFDPIEAANAERNSNRTLVVGAVLLTAGALAVAGCGGEGQSSTVGTASPESALATGTTGKPVTQAEVRELLSVSATSFDCVEDADNTANVVTLTNGFKVVKPVATATLPVRGGVKSQESRLWSDAISTPLEHTESKDAALREIQTQLCEDPEYAVTVANMFANMNVDGTKVVNLNEWLRPYAGNASRINDQAQKLFPGYGKKASELDADKALAANQKETELAEKLATLLERFDNNGIQSDIPTTVNYHLTAGGLVAGKLPEVELNSRQYTGQFIVFRLTTKEGRCIQAVMFNTLDKRPAESAICKPKVIKTSPKPQPKTAKRITIPPTPRGTTPKPRPTPTTPETPRPHVPGPKVDRNVTPAGVPGQNRGSGTAPTGPTGPGTGPAGQPVNPNGSVGGETLPTPPATDPTPPPIPQEPQAPAQPGEQTGTTSTTPAAPATGSAGTGDASTDTVKP